MDRPVLASNQRSPRYASSGRSHRPSRRSPARRRLSSSLLWWLLGTPLIVGTVVALALFSGSPEPSSVSATPSEPEGVTVAADGATLVLPAGWDEVPLDATEVQGFLDDAAASNPEIADALEGALSNVSDLGVADVP